jgi:hypothetical protein
MFVGAILYYFETARKHLLPSDWVPSQPLLLREFAGVVAPLAERLFVTHETRDRAALCNDEAVLPRSPLRRGRKTGVVTLVAELRSRRMTAGAYVVIVLSHIAVAGIPVWWVGHLHAVAPHTERIVA